ncbi:MAG: hypothetical protein JWN70_2034 [Planctomycetaceae bacterium]|nr:hypothetical protein [Planctomycetaceae bacterium]
MEMNREAKVAGFVKSIWSRNVRETVVSFILIAWIGVDLCLTAAPDLMTCGKVLLLLGIGVVLAVLWGQLHIPRSELSLAPPGDNVERWRHHMTQQSRFLRYAWLWYVLPLFVPGTLIVLSRVDEVPTARLVTLGGVALLIGAAVVWLNIAVAKGIERDRDLWLDDRCV